MSAPVAQPNVPVPTSIPGSPAAPVANPAPVSLPTTPAAVPAPMPIQSVTSAFTAPTAAPTPIPTTPGPTAAQNALGSSVAGFGTNLQTYTDLLKASAGTADTAPAGGSLKDILKGILTLNGKLATKGDETNRVNSELGIDAKSQQVQTLTNEYNSRSRYYDNLIKGAQTQNVEGKSAQGITEQVDDLTRQKNSELADIAIQHSAATGDLSTAQTLAKQKIDAEFEPVQAQIDNLKSYYQLAQNDMTDTEKTAANAAIKDKQDQLDEQKQMRLKEYDEKIKQSDPLYRAQVANAYSEIAARRAASSQTLNGKAQTAPQVQIQGYADRTNQSDVIIGKLGSQFASAGLGNILGSLNPTNLLKSSDRQQYEQAQRNFVNAVLRRESGAAISASEFDSAKKQYFPQPGDSPAVVAQKEENRQTTISNLYQQSNVQRSALPGQIIQDGSGKQYQVGDDGITLIPL